MFVPQESLTEPLAESLTTEYCSRTFCTLSSNIAHCRFHFSAQRSYLAFSMASYLAAKRFFSSSLLSKSLLPPAASASRSVHTNAMHNYDDDQNVEFESRSERSFPRTARRDCTFSGSCSRAL